MRLLTSVAWGLVFLSSHACPSWLEIHALAARIVGYSRHSQMCMLAVLCTIKPCWLQLRSSVCAQQMLAEFSMDEVAPTLAART